MYGRRGKDSRDITPNIYSTRACCYERGITSSTASDVKNDSASKFVLLSPSTTCLATSSESIQPFPRDSRQTDTDTTLYPTYVHTASPSITPFKNQQHQCDIESVLPLLTPHTGSNTCTDGYNGRVLGAARTGGSSNMLHTCSKGIDIRGPIREGISSSGSPFSTSPARYPNDPFYPDCSLPHTPPVVAVGIADIGVSNKQPSHGRRMLRRSADGIAEQETKRNIALQYQDSIKQQIMEHKEKKEREKRIQEEEDRVFEERILREYEVKSGKEKLDNNRETHVRPDKEDSKMNDTGIGFVSINESNSAKVRRRHQEGAGDVDVYKKQNTILEEKPFHVQQREISSAAVPSNSNLRQMYQRDQTVNTHTEIGEPSNTYTSSYITEVDLREWSQKIQNRDTVVGGANSSNNTNDSEIIDIFLRADYEEKGRCNNGRNDRKLHVNRRASNTPGNTSGDICMGENVIYCNMIDDDAHELECAEHKYIPIHKEL